MLANSDLDKKNFSFLQASLHDVVMKNIEKIKKPRSANSENLY